MRTAITITARMKSTRLPLKVLRLINNIPLIEQLILRLKKAKLVDMIILCTSLNPQDEILVDYAEKLDIKCFRGDETDVLKRLYDAAKLNSIDFIVSTTADNPLTDPIYIDKIISRYLETQADYITIQGLPLGTFSYGVKMKALEFVIEQKKEENTEIWGIYFEKTPSFRKEIIIAGRELNYPEYRLTVDTPDDLKLMREIFSGLQHQHEVFSLKSVISLLKQNPELLEINSKYIQRKALDIDYLGK
jgi:spore coat polysaccharide biosynthesis protein SpsF